MINVQIDKSISDKIPHIKVGVIQYYNIVIGDSPQMIKGRIQFFQETLGFDLDTKPLTDYNGISEWRTIFRKLQTNVAPSHEALYTYIKDNGSLPLTHSAMDLNTFFSLHYVLPVGIYDTSAIKGDVLLRLGFENESYEDTSNKPFFMNNKIVSVDSIGPFGSPIVDSQRTIVTTRSTSALQIFYFLPTMPTTEAKQLLEAAGSMFTQVHGGEYKHTVALPLN